MAEELDAIGVMSQLDARALELLVEAYTEYRHHCETLDREGYTYAVYSEDDPDEGKEREIRMIKPHPAAMMKADAWKRMCNAGRVRHDPFKPVESQPRNDT
jgi:P27 family predicted phage terminase small subunit